MKLRLLLLDDLPKNREQVKAALIDALKDRGEVVEFVPGVGGESLGTYERRLFRDLQTHPNAPADLVVADRDLSGYTEHYRGLSEATVRRAADTVGVPECGYARGERPDDPDYVRRGEEREASIRLSFKPDIGEFARRVVGVAQGFVAIAYELKTMKTIPRQPAAKLLATILGKP
jgi:hypothetical protein